MLLWDYWPGPEGGAERQCRGLVRELSCRDIETVVITSRFSFRSPSLELNGSAYIVRLGLLCPLALIASRLLTPVIRFCSASNDKLYQDLSFWANLPFRWLARLSFLCELRVRLWKNNFGVDLLHVHESTWLAGVGVWLTEKWQVPVACKIRNKGVLNAIGYDVPFRRVWYSLRPRSFFFALNELTRDALIEKGVAADRIEVIPNGVDIPAEVPEHRTSNEVLYVGNFTQGASHKGFDILLTAWAEVSKTLGKAELVMVGGGDASCWIGLTRQLGCFDSVRFVGSVDDPAPFFASAELFVLPSRHEGMSNALLEAQSWGLPAVVSDIPANIVVVDDKVTGRVVPVEDPEALAKGILGLLKDPRVRRAMGRAGRKKMKRSFSRQLVTDRYIETYWRLVKEINDCW
ncbi:hypothetical protein GKODMF_10855 [Candidatus Electrothrix gigas]